MRAFVVFVLMSVFVYAEWTSVDSGRLQDMMNDLAALNSNVYNLKETVQGSSDYMGLHTYMAEGYLAYKSIRDGEDYYYKHGYEGLGRVEINNPWSDNNKTMFSHNDQIRDNTDYYSNNILSYYSQEHNMTINNSRPDSMMFDYPYYGNMFSVMTNRMASQGFGINAIKESEQTQALRNEVASVQSKVQGMITNDYSNAYIDYDFSGIGQYFLNDHTMSENPLVNLRGRVNIKPLEDDALYPIWHRYFDRSSSQFAVLIKYAFSTIGFLWFTLMVINDLMAIVNA